MTYQTDLAVIARAIAAGAIGASVLGVAWGLFFKAGLRGTPYDWSFWFCLLLGFGVAESVSRAANRKRGERLQLIAIGAVLLGTIVSRVVLNARLPRPVTLTAFLQDPIAVGRLLHLDLLTLLFVALACAIAYVRFR